MSRGLHSVDYIVVLAYLAGVLLVGFWYSREQKEGDDFFVAGRKMPWLAVGLSIVATLLSTVSYLATPGEVIQHGLALAMGWLSLPIAFVIINFVWIPFLMKLRVVSIYEYLQRRFGLAARWVGAGLFVFVLRLIWMAIIVLTASRAVAQITHESVQPLLPGEWSLSAWTQFVLVSVGLLATGYTMLGGMKAVIWTDVVQFIVLFGGAVLTLLYVAIDTGTGPSVWWNNVTSEAHEWPDWYSTDLTVRNTVLFTCMNAVFWYSCTFLADQVAVQRYFSTPSVAAAVKGNIVNFVADYLTMLLLSVCGMALLTYYLDPAFQTEIIPGVTDPRDPAVADKVFPHFIAHGLPMGVAGLVVAALFAVAMSSLDSGVNSVAAVLTLDFFRVLRPDLSKTDELWLARRLTLLVGVACTAMAWGMMAIPDRYNIIGITARTFNCALGPMAAMFVAGMFFPRVGQGVAVFSTLVGFIAAIAIAWWSEMLGLVGFQAKAISPFLITPLAATSTVVLAAVLGAVFPTDPSRAQPWLWWTIARQNEKPEQTDD